MPVNVTITIIFLIIIIIIIFITTNIANIVAVIIMVIIIASVSYCHTNAVAAVILQLMQHYNKCCSHGKNLQQQLWHNSIHTCGLLTHQDQLPLSSIRHISQDVALSKPSPKEHVCLLVSCLMSQKHASVSQGQIYSDNFMCCHTEIVVADQAFHLTQSQYTDNGPTDPVTPGAWQGRNWGANFSVTGMTRPGKIPAQAGIEPQIFCCQGRRLNHKANKAVTQGSTTKHTPAVLFTSKQHYTQFTS